MAEADKARQEMELAALEAKMTQANLDKARAEIEVLKLRLEAAQQGIVIEEPPLPPQFKCAEVV